MGRRSSSYPSKVCWRVTVVYESIDGRRMRMWSRLLNDTNAWKLKHKLSMRGLAATVYRDLAVSPGPIGERFPPGWCEELT